MPYASPFTGPIACTPSIELSTTSTEPYARMPHASSVADVEPPVSTTRLRRMIVASDHVKMPMRWLPSKRLFSIRWPPPLNTRAPLRNPRTVQPRIVVFRRSSEWMPVALVDGPAPSPPSLKPLQSIVTLFAATVIALPLADAVERSLSKHQTPCVDS